MQKLYITLLLLLSHLPGIISQNNSANDPIKYNKAPNPGSYAGCEGFRLLPGFTYKATAGKNMTFRVDQSICKPESHTVGASSDHNYIVTVTPLDPTSVANYSTDGKLSMDYKTRANISVQYFDGLGRPVQTIIRGNTPTKKDIITLQEYDPIGRESQTWLPINSSANSGAYRNISDIKARSEAVYGDARAFAELIYEASPLNRITKQYGPGAEWHTAKAGVETNYKTNDATLTCALFSVEGTGLTTKVKKNGNYAAGQLYVIETINEVGSKSYEFKDKLGQVVMTRQINKNGTTEEKLDTYYVYDDFGNLCFVLPPLVSNAFSTNGTWDENNSTPFKQFAYHYKYNDRNLCIRKKLPATGWTSYVYDKADRLIFSQDAEQAIKKEWTYSIPDALGRVVLTGICKNTDITETNYKNKVVTAKFAASTKTNFGYTISGLQTALTSNTVLSANYYDNYNFVNNYGFPNWTSDNKNEYDKPYTGTKGYESKGLLTGTATAILEQAKYIYNVMYYDYKGNIVQTKTTNHLGGTESEYLALTFTGQPTQKLHIHTANGKTTSETYTYSYDHAGRLIDTKHSLNGATPVLLAKNTYDELGRLQTTTPNNQANLKTTYAYNIRSWIKNIKSHHFTEDLTYYHNGDIKTQEWGQAGRIRTYTFDYDNLSRIKTAAYTKAATDNSNYATGYTYDMHGNIKTISRQGLSETGYKQVDNLTLAYTGNQLTHVNDAAANVTLSISSDFKDNSKAAVTVNEYTYNANGAMTKDLNKGITGINYNSLNLPQEMVISHPSARAKNYYTYTAGGTKLRTIHKFDPKLQATPIIGSTAGDAALATTITTDYVVNKIYEDGVLKKIMTDNGYIEGGIYYFYVKDHLGNNRIVANQSAGVIQSNQYYPFGMLFAESTNQDKQDFKYNGKELDQMHGLNQYDYSARYYDPAISRFTTMDPLAEKKPWFSPYHYCSDNPLTRIDPTGLTDYVRRDGTQYAHVEDGSSTIESIDPLPEVTVYPNYGWTRETVGGVTREYNLYDSPLSRPSMIVGEAPLESVHLEFNILLTGRLLYQPLKSLFPSEPRFFRAMSNAEYAALDINKGLSYMVGKELFVSTQSAYSRAYLNKMGYDVLVEFTMKRGAMKHLKDVGVFHRTFAGSSGWASRGNLLWKVEKEALNLGIQQNTHLFNPWIKGFKAIK